MNGKSAVLAVQIHILDGSVLIVGCGFHIEGKSLLFQLLHSCGKIRCPHCDVSVGSQEGGFHTLKIRSSELRFLTVAGLQVKHHTEKLCQYDWPNNYTQFKHILQTLATMTDSTYIRSSAVAELLTKERSRHRRSVPAAAAVNTDCTLDEMIREVIQQVVASNNGNRAAAARQLGISRTTLWRYLSRKEGGEGES